MILTSYLYKLSAEDLPAIRKGCTDKATRKAIRKLEKQLASDVAELVAFRDQAQSSKNGGRVATLVKENPGITYNQIADKLGINKKTVIRVVSQDDSIVKKPRTDLPKIFNNHPTGLWLSEEG